MKRWLPSPVLSAALTVLWLLLSASLSPRNWLIGGAIGVAIPLLTASLRPERASVGRPMVALRLVAVVMVDVVVSALELAGAVLRSRSRPPGSAFVDIPLELRDAHGLAALALITTIVPGTIWSELKPDRRSVVLHVFDIADAAGYVAHYKRRYEKPLMEIFE